jgi:hypothetical protein
VPIRNIGKFIQLALRPLGDISVAEWGTISKTAGRRDEHLTATTMPSQMLASRPGPGPSDGSALAFRTNSPASRHCWRVEVRNHADRTNATPNIGRSVPMPNTAAMNRQVRQVCHELRPRLDVGRNCFHLFHPLLVLRRQERASHNFSDPACDS